MQTSAVTANLAGEENLLLREFLWAALASPPGPDLCVHVDPVLALRGCGEGHLFIAHKFSLLLGLPAEPACREVSALNPELAFLVRVGGRRRGRKNGRQRERHPIAEKKGCSGNGM